MTDSKWTLPLLALLIAGPFLLVLVGMAYASLVRWGASCVSSGRELHCGEFLGLWEVNPESLSYVGGGYALAFSLVWAAAILAVLVAIGIIFVFVRAFS